MPRLYIIRHGRPLSGWSDVEGDPDPGLDPQGRLQAEAARDWLLARPLAERPKRVVSSPLRRCRETAQPTAEALGVPLEIDPAVGEIPTPGAVAHADRSAWLQQAFQGAWSEIQGDLDYQAWRRSVVDSLAARGDTAVFSHFVAINAVVSTLTGDDRVVAFRPDHTSITVLETDGRNLRLVERGPEAATSVL
jgi:broad specificity phosphatase PhoE